MYTLPFPPSLGQAYGDAVALSNGGAEHAGHNTAEGVQDWHAAAPAVVTGCLTLHAGEAPQSTATWREEEEKKLNIFTQKHTPAAAR